MKDKSIIIVGAGMGGLGAGIYGGLNGYRTQIFEMNSVPGGQCAAWKRKGYTFDACVHHLFGCASTSLIYRLWEELGAVPREFVPTRECVSVLSPKGKLFIDYYDLEMLESHMNELAPFDRRVIHDYVQGIRSTAKSDAMGTMMLGSRRDLVTALPGLLRSWRWLRPTMAQYAERFGNPFLRRAFPLLVYSFPFVPLVVHLSRHAYGLTGAIRWPVGGAVELAKSIATRYTDLGGELHYRSKVVKVLTEDGRAFGVKLEDGSEHHADIIISNADGRRTILEMLEGRFMDDRVRGYCEPPDDEMPWAVHVFLGVNRDLSKEPSSLIMLLDAPVTIANHECHSIEMQMYGFDPGMAPEGKGVIKVELVSQYSYWKKLAENRTAYEEEKRRVADQVIDLLESRYFAGLRQQVEVIDVPTLLTWERFTGGTMGLGFVPKRKISVTGSVFGKSLNSTLPGLSDFYFAGTWATSAGALFMNALSGKRVVQGLCKADGRTFTSSAA